jgi:hypothetical protein
MLQSATHAEIHKHTHAVSKTRMLKFINHGHADGF